MLGEATESATSAPWKEWRAAFLSGLRRLSLDGRARRPGGNARGKHASFKEDSAQATLEYALVLVAFMAMVIGFAAVWRASSDGSFAHLVQQAASHALDAEGAVDIALY